LSDRTDREREARQRTDVIDKTIGRSIGGGGGGTIGAVLRAETTTRKIVGNCRDANWERRKIQMR
jgi:hypothetical protein